MVVIENTWLIKEPVSIKVAEVLYPRGHQRVYLNPPCSVYITLKPAPVSFSCPHAEHSFYVPLHLVNKQNYILEIIDNNEVFNIKCLGRSILYVF